MTSKSMHPLYRCISTYKYSASLIISVITAIILSVINLPFMHISLITILMFCISLFYLYSNKLIEGNTPSTPVTTATLAEAESEAAATEATLASSSKTPTPEASLMVDNVIDGVGGVFKKLDLPVDIKAGLDPSYITELKGIVSSITDPGAKAAATLDALVPDANKIPNIDTTPKTQNTNVLKTLGAIRDIKSKTTCNYSQETECVAADSCIWVIRKSNNNINTTSCERGDKSGPYPVRNTDGSLTDVDRDFYKIDK